MRLVDFTGLIRAALTMFWIRIITGFFWQFIVPNGKEYIILRGNEPMGRD